MPERIQRQYGLPIPAGAKYVGRPTVWGNPVTCTSHGCMRKPCGCCESYRCCLDVYREYVMSGIEGRDSYTGSIWIAIDAANGYPNRTKLIKRLPELRGKDLACWCPLPQPSEPDLCHAAVLLELANGPALGLEQGVSEG